MGNQKELVTTTASAPGKAPAGDRSVADVEMLVGGVELSRFLEAYPLPWSSTCQRDEQRPRGMNRSTIAASDGTQVASGMNNAKADFIVHRVNSFPNLVTALHRLAIVRHVRMTYGGGETPSGGSCNLCKSEWAETSTEFHRDDCLLAVTA